MVEKIKRFRLLEWLWLAHAVACVGLYLVVYVVIGGTAPVVLSWLLRPVGWLLDYRECVGLLPEWFVHYLFALTVLLNGGLWYVLLRLCFRRQPARAERGRGERESLRAIYRCTPRGMRGLILLPALVGLVLYLGLHVELPESYRTQVRIERVYRLRDEAFARVAPAAVSELLATAGKTQPGWKKIQPVAVYALGYLARRRPEAYQGVILPVLVALLEDADDEVRLATADALGGFEAQAEAAIPALLRRLEIDGDKAVARAAVVALGKIGRQPEQVVPVLARRMAGHLATGRPDGGELAALRGFGPAARPAVPVLERALEVFDSRYALSAARVLAEIEPGNRRLAQMLEEFSLAADGEEHLRILGTIGAIPLELRSIALSKIVDEEILRLEGFRRSGALPEKIFLEMRQRLLREK